MLDDPETVRVRQGSTLNKSIIALTTLLKDLSTRRNDYVMYETATVTHLMKDVLGGNSLTCAIFNIQHGDAKGSSLTLNFLKYAKNIQNFPITNNSKAFGLLKKFRVEINASKGNKAGGGGGGMGDNNNMSGINNETSN